MYSSRPTSGSIGAQRRSVGCTNVIRNRYIYDGELEQDRAGEEIIDLTRGQELEQLHVDVEVLTKPHSTMF